MANETTTDASALTPVMRQYFAAKEQYPDCLMFCRIGDFYELFYEDAILVARELQLTLTARDREKKQPMCGVPYHAAEIYIQRLLKKGYRVALCEQMEDPRTGGSGPRGIVKREVTRVLTPGTAMDPSLGAEQSNYLVSVFVEGSGANCCCGMALLDLSTGEFRATEFAGVGAWASVVDELGRVRPVELLYPAGGFWGGGASSKQQVLRSAQDDNSKGEGSGGDGSAGDGGDRSERSIPGSSTNGGSKKLDDDAAAGPDADWDAIRTKTAVDEWVFSAEYALPLLRNHFKVHSLDGMGLAGHEAAAVAAGALLHYIQKTQQGRVEHLDGVRYYERSTCLELDAVSVRNLELVEPLFSGESAQTTLFYTLDACCTPMGKRLLRATLLRPASELGEIEARLEAVGEAVADLRGREGVRRSMDGVLDLERLLARVALDSAGPREVMSLAATLGCLPGVVQAVGVFRATRWKELGRMPLPAQQRSFCEEEFKIKLPVLSPTEEPVRSVDKIQGSLHSATDGEAVHRSGRDDGVSSGTEVGRASGFDAMEDLHDRVVRTLADEPPVNFADGGVIREGLDAELDELRELSRSGRQALVAIEERERTRTGIGSLKVRFNSVFGYYLEVTKANAKSVPADYERKQTLVNAERFTTPELKEYEAKILTAQERSGEIERRIFSELRQALLAAAGRMRDSARRVAEIDLLANFAHLAALRGWVRPEVEVSGVLEFVAARHPVVERRMEESGAGRFVPNSLYLDAGWGKLVNPTHRDDAAMNGAPGSLGTPARDDAAMNGAPEGLGLGGEKQVLRSAQDDNFKSADDEVGSKRSLGPSLMLITGPNMGGKSTYLRQAALLVVMAQCGCFVPAERMRLGLVDRIYTRIGASDNVARGRSTFMVEMTETAAILNTATSRSLVLLDEMGRGTATYDGLSLAWATVEYLHDRIGARTLFATHYHELTLLSERLARLKNLRVTVKETSSGIVFLHTVEAGPASKSYGIEVARLAGLPAGVIGRAREVLKLHEKAETQQVREAAGAGAPQLQMTMFTPLSQRIVDRIGELDVDGLTPREALALLAELQRELKG